MTKQTLYIDNLIKSSNWIDYLKENSGLPGKRANLELLLTAVELGDEKFFKECLKYNEKLAPTNTQGEFVAMCGVTGLGKLISNGKHEYFDLIREYANDSRWRIREGVAMALQLIGDKNFDDLINGVRDWITGSNYEKRAVVAGLCEPRLLKNRDNSQKVLETLNKIMESIDSISNKNSETFRVLKKGLGYGFSVAIVACPEKGKDIFEKLLLKSDKDILWILKENLKKKRLEKMDKDWTNKMKNASA